jgi:hypothetical protein
MPWAASRASRTDQHRTGLRVGAKHAVELLAPALATEDVTRMLDTATAKKETLPGPLEKILREWMPGPSGQMNH